MLTELIKQKKLKCVEREGKNEKQVDFSSKFL